MEAGVVVSKEGRALHWHVPADRTSASLPDSRSLWYVMWEAGEDLGGFAHSHPGSGTPLPSHTDVTTFAALEAGLGRRLRWWIVSEDGLSLTVHGGSKDRLDYVTFRIESERPEWLDELRRVSYGTEVRTGPA